MENTDWRIFLSYRGESEGLPFSKRLYSYLTEDPLHDKMYGEVFFSPETAHLGGNFREDIPDIMKNVRYFVMPLTQNYFDDFWDEKNNCPDKDSITYIEINEAMNVGSRFICIVFPGFQKDPSLLDKLFQKNAAVLACAIVKDYDLSHEEELMREICDAMVCEDYDTSGAADYIKDLKPNVLLSFKKDMEDRTRFPFYHKLYDVKRITLLNFASSVFIAGIDIASIYKEADFLKRWFSYHLSKGNIEANIILTDPHSSAAQDAALYKMYPVGLETPKDEIILRNMNKLFQFMRNNPEAKLNVYLTKIALPYGVMMTEHKDPKNNHIKVDLYAPVTNDDGMRPSFYLLQQNEETRALYSFFEGNVRSIMEAHVIRFDGHPDTSWLKNKQFIHRGRIRPDLLPHTKRAYEACLEEKCPIEVDLLEMRDGIVIAARDDQDLRPYGYDKPLSELSIRDLRKINRQAGPDRILTLEEFLDYVRGEVPVLFEIKSREKGMTPGLQNHVDKIVRMLLQYAKSFGTRFAVHSADPAILQRVKTQDCMIPCGIITMDYSPMADQVGEDFCKLHATGDYTKIFTPDFISCDVNYLENEIVRDLCDKLNIPLLAWTVKDAEDQLLAKDYHCDSVIVEGGKSFL